jgi:arylsulfatase A-like enzyme
MTLAFQQRFRARQHGALFAGLALILACEPEPRPPNILFIFSDDHAAHAISAYGSVINRTPNLDRLAAEGMLFVNAFVTNSICGPSRATVLTGQFGHLNGVPVNEDSLHPSVLTFPKLLREAGWQTALIGKWHLWAEPAGFEHYEVLQGQGPYYNPVLYGPTDSTAYTGYTTDIITDRVIEWLSNRRDPNRPFMLMYQHKAPHRPWDPSAEYLPAPDDVPIAEPATLFDDWANRTSAAKTQEMSIARDLVERDLKLIAPPNLTPEQLEQWNRAYDVVNAPLRDGSLSGDSLTRFKYQRYIRDYVASVASIDDNLGRLLAYLDESGLAENTVVVYTSDQGFFLGDHGWFDKRWMYEESMRTPLIVRWPGTAAPGSRNTDLVQNLDYAETILDIAGVTIPPSMQGRSLVPLLRGETPSDWRDALYYQYFEYPGWHMVRRHYGIRTKRHKLIHYYEIGEWELFDLESDPDELRSIHDDPAYQEIVEELKIRLDALRAQYQVPAEDPVPYRPWPPPS